MERVGLIWPWHANHQNIPGSVSCLLFLLSPYPPFMKSNTYFIFIKITNVYFIIRFSAYSTQSEWHSSYSWSSHQRWRGISYFIWFYPRRRSFRKYLFHFCNLYLFCFKIAIYFFELFRYFTYRKFERPKIRSFTGKVEFNKWRHYWLLHILFEFD